MPKYFQPTIRHNISSKKNF
uniref:Uncharacterized protein n=1 Tax=Rhizophora mucronata TaxID=61149 RepID=A0A2P2NVQ6_RHIMU